MLEHFQKLERLNPTWRVRDMEFICEQFWLGGCVDASYRFAKWTLLWSSERRLYL